MVLMWSSSLVSKSELAPDRLDIVALVWRRSDGEDVFVSGYHLWLQRASRCWTCAVIQGLTG